VVEHGLGQFGKRGKLLRGEQVEMLAAEVIPAVG
jgi:hypothetical protein